MSELTGIGIGADDRLNVQDRSKIFIPFSFSGCKGLHDEKVKKIKMWGNKAPGPFKLCIKGTYVKLSKKRSEQRFKNALQLFVGQ